MPQGLSALLPWHTRQPCSSDRRTGRATLMVAASSFTVVISSSPGSASKRASHSTSRPTALLSSLRGVVVMMRNW